MNQSEELKELIVEHLFDDDKFRSAAKKFVAANFFKDPTLRAIFKERSGSIVNHLFGFRNSRPTAKATVKPKVRAKPVRAKAASSNSLTHGEAIISYLKKNKKPANLESISSGLQKMNHNCDNAAISSSLFIMKKQKRVKTSPHAGSGRSKFDWSLV